MYITFNYAAIAARYNSLKTHHGTLNELVTLVMHKYIPKLELKQILDSLGYSLGYIAIRTLEKYADTQQMILV